MAYIAIFDAENGIIGSLRIQFLKLELPHNHSKYYARMFHYLVECSEAETAL